RRIGHRPDDPPLPRGHQPTPPSLTTPPNGDRADVAPSVRRTPRWATPRGRRTRGRSTLRGWCPSSAPAPARRTERREGPTRRNDADGLGPSGPNGLSAATPEDAEGPTWHLSPSGRRARSRSGILAGGQLRREGGIRLCVSFGARRRW